MFCVVFKVLADIIGSQRKKLIVQKPKVALNITGNYRGHICIPAHRIPHSQQKNQAKVRVADRSEQALREQQKLFAIIHAYAQRSLFFRYQIQ